MLGSLALVTFMILGDSHAAGHPGRELQVELRRRGHEVVRRGRVGLRSLSVRCPRGLSVAFLGTNDVPGPRLQREYARLGRCHGLYVVGPPRFWGKALDRRAREVAAVQRAYMSYRWIDGARTSPVGGRTRDGVHFTRAGARSWAQEIADELERRLP
jgi:hypothetical protein